VKLARSAGGAVRRIGETQLTFVQLYREGRYEEVIAVARQARDVAHHVLREEHPAFALSWLLIARVMLYSSKTSTVHGLTLQSMSLIPAMNVRM
jgi:hypothetical protein